ncbi:MAG TPA: hypothetical protein VF519_01645 [Mycobacteriales bacterium]|jgi:hypothetical protein
MIRRLLAATAVAASIAAPAAPAGAADDATCVVVPAIVVLGRVISPPRIVCLPPA